MHCKACGHHLTQVMDLGEVALAGAFLSQPEFGSEKRYPLTLEFCEACYLLQVGQHIPASELFSRYFYHSSATETGRSHFAALARELVATLQPRRALEIGCNDGVLMRPLQALGVDVVGVDPSDVTPADLPVVNGYWSSKCDLGKFDLIVANNVFAHIEDVNDALSGVAESLTDNGRFVFELNRLDSMIANLQYDWIYHEHRYYYSLLSLQKLLARHGLEIYHVQRLGTHAGSARYWAAKPGQTITHAIYQQESRERWGRLWHAERFAEFAEQAKAHREELRAYLAGRQWTGYGACGRTNTLLQWCGLGPDVITSIMDDAPAKHGYYTPGTHIPITPRHEAENVIVFAWAYLKEILPKLEGAHRIVARRIVVPLPHIYEHKQREAA